MNGICRSAFGSFGPTWMTVPPSLGGGLVDAGLRRGEVLVDDVLRQVADGDRRRGRGPAGDAAADEAGGAADAAAAGSRPLLEQAANTMTATLARAIDRPIDLSFNAVPPLSTRRLVSPLRDRVGRRRPPSADSIDGRLGLVSKGWDDDREDQEQPEGDALDLDRHAGEAERVLHDRHGEDRENDAGDRAPTRRRC